MITTASKSINPIGFRHSFRFMSSSTNKVEKTENRAASENPGPATASNDNTLSRDETVRSTNKRSTGGARSAAAPVTIAQLISSLSSPYTCVNAKCEQTYKVLRKVGSGAYGKVFASWCQSKPMSSDGAADGAGENIGGEPSEPIPCAIKMPTKISGSVITGISSLKEIDMLTRCNHPYILKLHGVETDLYSALVQSRGQGSSSASGAAAAASSAQTLPTVSSALSSSSTSSSASLICDPFQCVKAAKYDRVSLVMELAIANVEDVQVNSMSDEKLRLCITELLLALEYMHEKRIVHRDLKPGNILLFAKVPTSDVMKCYMQNLQPMSVVGTKQYAANKQQISRFLSDANATTLKICDFGLSKLCNNYLHTRGVVTLWYRAPEIATLADTNNRYSFASDWWSFGCILYEWITGTPFAASSTSGDDETQDRNLLEMIRSNLTRLDQNNWDVVHNALKNRSGFTRSEKTCLINILKHFLKLDPSERITPRNALNQSFFQPVRDKITQDRLRLPLTEFCASSYSTTDAAACLLSNTERASNVSESDHIGGSQPQPSTNSTTLPLSPITVESVSRQCVLDAICSSSASSSFSRESTEQLLDRLLQQRESVYLFAVELFRTRHLRKDYHTNRRLFLALELFDRLCLWLLMKRKTERTLELLDFCPIAPVDTLASTSGTATSCPSSSITSGEKIGVLFICLYYVAVKYLSSFEPNLLLRSLLTRKIVQDKLFSGSFFDELELFLVKEVLHYQVGPNRVIKTYDSPQGAVFSSLGKTVTRSRKKRTELIFLNAYEALCHLCSDGASTRDFDEASVLPLYLLHWKQKSSFFEFVKLFLPA